MTDRKNDHIELAFKSAVDANRADSRFYYEPMLATHPDNIKKPFSFLGKEFGAPLWVSSMTGGTEKAYNINKNLAKACKEFKLGMGLGSCRKIIDDNEHLKDFNLRPIIGDDRPLYANLGISQIEKLVNANNHTKITDLIDKLDANGLIIHINPMQEWFQLEGDRLNNPPIDSIKRVMDKLDISIIVKEVGQGMGPQSLKELLELPLDAIEFGAFGGTNFSKLEMIRKNNPAAKDMEPLAVVGEDACSMISYIHQLKDKINIKCKQLIISGGIRNFLDGYYYTSLSPLPSIYGQASSMLRHATEEYGPLKEYIKGQIEGFRMAEAFLRVKRAKEKA